MMSRDLEMRQQTDEAKSRTYFGASLRVPSSGDLAPTQQCGTVAILQLFLVTIVAGSELNFADNLRQRCA